MDAPEEADTGVLTPEGERLVREAVRKERERVRGKLTKEPQTKLGRKIKAKTDAPIRPIDRAIRKGAEKTFKPGGKSN